MRNAWIWIVVVVLVLGGGFLWWQSSQSSATPTGQAPTVGSTQEYTPPDQTAPSPLTSEPNTSGVSVDVNAGASVGTGASMSATVTYADSGFSPSPVVIKKGGTVTFINQGSKSMEVASGPHPQHTGFDSTSRTAHCASGYTGEKPFDECSADSSFSFTFNKTGTFPYHNHQNASDFGKVVVE